MSLRDDLLLAAWWIVFRKKDREPSVRELLRWYRIVAEEGCRTEVATDWLRRHREREDAKRETLGKRSGNGRETVGKR